MAPLPAHSHARYGHRFKLDGSYRWQDPTLRRFLVDGPVIIAGLRIQHEFEVQFTKAQCERLIEAYAALGGDAGMTEDAMRQACALPPSDAYGQPSELPPASI